MLRNSTYVSLLLAAFTLAGAAEVGAEEKLTTAPVIPMRVGDETRVSGTVVPFREVTLSAKIPGSVTAIAGREGDVFKAGTALVTVDDAQIRAQREAAVASFMQAQAAMQSANVQFNRELLSPQTGKKSGMGFPMMMDEMFSPFQGQTSGANRPPQRRSFAAQHLLLIPPAKACV